MSSRPEITQIAVTDLAPEHLVVLERAISNILSTDLAFETFAQIVDGLPIRDVYRDYYPRTRPDFERNLEPSQEARQVVEALQESFSIRSLQIETKVAQAYQNTSIKSREFDLRLMEIVAHICHDIATRLFINAGGGLHKPDPKDAQPPQLPGELPLVPVPPKPTELYHPDYQAWDQYPKGIADITGYWAEYRLFGGVVLFDRGESGTECKDVFIHPVGFYRIYQVSEAQIQQFTTFLLSEPSQDHQTSHGLRISAEKYARRIDPYDAMSLHIYRNKYERKIPPRKPVRCVVRGDDFPELTDSMADLVSRVKSRKTAGDT